MGKWQFTYRQPHAIDNPATDRKLLGTAWCGSVCQVVWGPGESSTSTRFLFLIGGYIGPERERRRFEME